MRFETLSGIQYLYNEKTNSIDISDDKFVEINPYVHFKELSPLTTLPSINNFIIEVTRDCNFRCVYCCYSGKYSNNRTHEKVSIKNDQIKDILNFIERSRRQKSSLKISFYGGEPLLQYDVVKCFIAEAEQRWLENVSFSISTNGLLLSEEKIFFFIDHRVELSISLDGYNAYHDRYRKSISGNGTFQNIYNNLSVISKMFPDFFNSQINILITIQDIADLKEIAIQWQEDPLLLKKTPAFISGLSPNYSVGVEILDEEKRKRILYELLNFFILNPNNRVIQKFFYNLLIDLFDRPIYENNKEVMMSTCLPQNNKCFVDVNGKLGVCEKMSDKYRIGDIHIGFDFDKINELVDDLKSIRMTKCSTCEISRLCDSCLLQCGLNQDELSIYCKNRKVNMKLNLLMLCEMVEAGLIDNLYEKL